MRSLSRIMAVGCTLLGCVGCDQASKSAARVWLAAGTPHSFIGDSLRLELVQNPGSFLSLGASLPPQLRFAVFTGAVGLVLAVLAGAAFFATGLDRRRCVALAMLAGGGAGNLIDRIFHDGRVTDFLNLGLGTLRTGIFNIADMAILGGAILLMLGSRESAPPRLDP